MNHFSPDGICLFGKVSKGKHASALSSSWVEWAKINVKGFEQSYNTALKAKPKDKPKGRKYILDYSKKFTPIQKFDPDDAVDWEDDPGMGRYFEQG